MDKFDKSENNNNKNSVQGRPDESGILSDGIFSMKVSEDMGIRNILRSGLVEAQGKDSEKIPMFVSWPNWLDDGIVCMFARDFHNILGDTVRNTVISINKELDNSEYVDDEEDFTSEPSFEPLSGINELSGSSYSEGDSADKTNPDVDIKKMPSAGTVLQATSSKIIKNGKYKT